MSSLSPAMDAYRGSMCVHPTIQSYCSSRNSFLFPLLLEKLTMEKPEDVTIHNTTTEKMRQWRYLLILIVDLDFYKCDYLHLN